MNHFAILEGGFGKVAVVEVLLRPDLESQFYYEGYYKRFVGGDHKVLILESNTISKRMVFADREEAILTARQLMVNRVQELQNAIEDCRSGVLSPLDLTPQPTRLSAWERLVQDPGP